MWQLRFQLTDMLGSGEADRFHPLPDGPDHLADDVLRQLPVGVRLDVRHHRPHGGRRRLELPRKRRVVRARLELDVRTADAHVLVHALEHLEEAEPHGEQRVVAHELVGDGRVREHVVEVGDEGPVAVVLHDVLGAVDDAVDGAMLVLVLVAGGNSIVNYFV